MEGRGWPLFQGVGGGVQEMSLTEGYCYAFVVIFISPLLHCSHSGTPLFQPPEMRTPLYTVELLYSNPLK